MQCMLTCAVHADDCSESRLRRPHPGRQPALQVLAHGVHVVRSVHARHARADAHNSICLQARRSQGACGARAQSKHPRCVL